MEELRKFQSSIFDTIARRELVEDQNTLLEVSGRIQELQNEINCMNDSQDFQDAESIRSGNSHVTSRPVSFPPQPIPEGMLRHSLGMPSRREGPPSIWDTHGISGNVFANPDASSSAPYPFSWASSCSLSQRTPRKTLSTGYDCPKDLEDNRSISVIWCTERTWRARSPSSDHRRSGRGGFREIGSAGLPDSKVSETSNSNLRCFSTFPW